MGGARGKNRTWVSREVTPEKLVAFFHDKTHTHLQASQAAKAYIGKWMKYSGPIHDVRSGYISFADPANPDRMGLVSASFDDGWDDRLGILHPKMQVLIEGQIRSVDSWSISLHHCSLNDENL